MKSSTLLKIILIITLYQILGCKNSTETQVKEDEIKKIDSLKKTLIGKWGGDDRKFVAWDITKDSIIYPETKKAYKYEIINGDFIFQRDEYLCRLERIQVSGDTLKFYLDFDETSKDVLTKAFKIID
jgi:hypothetical protein